MRWFKHLTDASDDDFLKLLEHEYGWEGYGRWWKLCEIVGKNVKKNDTVASRSLPWPEWQTKLKGKRNQLRCFVECLANQGRISFKETGDILEISLPKLLKYRDEYSKKSGHATDENPDKVGVQNTEDRKQKTEKSSSPAKPSAKDQVEGLSLDDDLVAYAKKHGIGDVNALADVLEDWRLFCRSKGYRTTSGPIADARSSFMRWIRNAKNFGPKPSLFSHNQQPRHVAFREDD